jgi:hypothetical protein
MKLAASEQYQGIAGKMKNAIKHKTSTIMETKMTSQLSTSEVYQRLTQIRHPEFQNRSLSGGLHQQCDLFVGRQGHD